MEILKRIETEHPDALFTLSVSRYCNYNCSYCSEKNCKVGNKKPEITQKVLNKLKNELDKMPTLDSIHLIGGEVSQFNIDPLLEIIKEKGIKKGMVTTNLSAKKEWYLNLLNYFEKVTVTASFHDEYWGYEGFFKKIASLNDYENMFIIIEAVINDDIYEKVFNLYNLVNDYNKEHKKSIKLSIDLDRTKESFSKKVKDLQAQASTTKTATKKNVKVTTSEREFMSNKREIISMFEEQGCINTIGAACIDIKKKFLCGKFGLLDDPDNFVVKKVCFSYDNYPKIIYDGEEGVICQKKCTMCHQRYKIIFDPDKSKITYLDKEK